MSLITASTVNKTIQTVEGTLTILKSVNLEINRGETLAIHGRSGSGKTTLLGLLAGLDLPSSGTIIVDGKRWHAMNEDERARYRLTHIGFIFQHFYLLPYSTALENVMLPAELAGKKNAQQKALDLLEQVGLSQRLHHYPAQLSGGEQQRVAIARAFILEPDILFADEPTGSLDVQTGEKVLQLLFSLNEQHQTTFVCVTHEPSLAKRCQRSVLLEEGILIAGVGTG